MNIFNRTQTGSFSNKRLKRLKQISGAIFTLLLLFTAGFQSGTAMAAEGDEGTSFSGFVVVAVGEQLPEGTEAWLISDNFEGPLDVSTEEVPENVVAQTGVNFSTGEYTFSNIEDGFYLVVIRPPTDSAFAITDPYFVHIEEGFDVFMPDLMLHKAQLSGSVVESGTDEGISARVELYSKDDGLFFSTKTIDGKFSFGGLETSGEYEISAWPDEDEPYAPSEFQIINIAIDSSQTIIIELNPPSVTGLVKDPEGEPLRDVHISAWQKHDDGTVGPPLTEEELPTWADDMTGRDGSFALGALQPGTYQVEAFGGPHNDLLPPDPIEIEIPYEGDPIIFEFKGFETGVKTLSGSVKDKDGLAITDAQVNAQHMTRQWWRSTQTDENGAYELNLVGGEWNIFIEPIHDFDDHKDPPPHECDLDQGECPPLPDCDPAQEQCPPPPDCDPAQEQCPPPPDCDPAQEQCPPPPDCELSEGECPPPPDCDPAQEQCPPPPDCDPAQEQCPPPPDCDPAQEQCPPPPDCELSEGECPPPPDCDPAQEQCPPPPDCDPAQEQCPPPPDCELSEGECPPECPTSISGCETSQVIAEEDGSDWIYTGGNRFVSFEDNEEIESLIEDFEVTTADASIYGYILNADGSAPTYWVSIGAYNSEGHGSFGEVNANGYFDIALPAGAYEVFIHADVNSGAEPPGVIQVNVADDEAFDMGEIKMILSSSSIKGSVTSNDLPVKDVKVVAWKIDGFAHREAETNSNGEYTLNVSPGLWFVTPAYSPDSDFVFNDPGFEVDVDDGETVIDIDFSVISSKSKIKGIVIDSDGTPLSNGVFGWVHVESIDEETEEPTGLNEDDPPGCEDETDCPPPPGCEDETDCPPIPGCEDETDCPPPPGCDNPDGCECPPTGELCDPHPGDCPPADEKCEPHPGDCPPDDAACDPGGFKPPSFMTGAPINNGSFSVQVPAGKYRVMVFVDGDGIFADQQLEVTVGENDIQEIEIAVQSADSNISGQLVDARTQEPIALEDGEELFGQVFAWSDNNFANAFIDESTGIYSMDVVSGTWHVDHWIEHPDYVAVFNPDAKITVTTESTVTFNLPVVKLDSELTGQVLDPSGNPIAGAEVIIHGTGDFEDVWLFRRTDASGTYRINVAYGDYVVEAAFVGREESRDWFMPEPVEVTVEADTSTTASPLQFREATGTLSGTVTASGATSDGKAFIWAWSDSGGFARQRIDLVTDGTDASGDYSLPVIDGTWYVDAVHESANSFWSGGQEVEVSGDTTLTLTLTKETIELPDTVVQTFSADEPFEMTMDDGTKISIPAGSMPVDSITETVSISIDPIASLPDQDHANVVNYGYQFLAKDSNGALIEKDFIKDVEITFYYDPNTTAGIPEDNLQVAYYSTTTELWTYVNTSFIDNEKNTITFVIDHFTDFAVVGDPSKAVSETDTPTAKTIYLPMVVR